MADSYFEYTLSKCRSSIIKMVCTRYEVKQKLQKSVTEEWNTYAGIISDRELLLNVSEFLKSGELFRCCYVYGDSERLYNRCMSSMRNILTDYRNSKSVTYDRLFDALTDVCWLIASVSASEQNRLDKVVLLSNQKQINIALKDYLELLYVAAIHEHNESVFVGEGIQAKNEHPFLPFRYDYKYQESARYVNSNLTPSELKEIQRQQQDFCTKHLTIYYGLTVTAALADNIRKGLA